MANMVYPDINKEAPRNMKVHFDGLSRKQKVDMMMFFLTHTYGCGDGDDAQGFEWLVYSPIRVFPLEGGLFMDILKMWNALIMVNKNKNISGLDISLNTIYDRYTDKYYINIFNFLLIDNADGLPTGVDPRVFDVEVTREQMRTFLGYIVEEAYDLQHYKIM